LLKVWILQILSGGCPGQLLGDKKGPEAEQTDFVFYPGYWTSNGNIVFQQDD
jgi:hypothetical protein